MSNFMKNRSEILFLYDIKDANPNGDPLDENKPRIDEETGINIVTDVRLKRTIRDYLMNFKNEEIFIREIRNEEGKLKTKEDRLNDLKIESPKELINKCIDIRLFGATTAIKNKTITFTGPVQFNFGRSLNKVNLTFVKGTTVMPSREAKGQGTFTGMYILPYSLICFYGIINENTAQHTQLSEDDVNLLLEAMWNGTKNLISRSKIGQMPRLLLKVNYKEENYHLGDLDKLIKIKDIDNIQEEKIRDIGDIELDASKLVETLNINKEKIESIDLKIDERVRINLEGLDTSIKINSISLN
ncbi:MAG TPA: type I-B CRISPR-associated protein Cas7/Csh2 [Candidatus Atribacteria bacterium]|nr:type I-B CRISPR-associated protein Cas7/Csh2 [Candidatus Atribacteria bacterium]